MDDWYMVPTEILLCAACAEKARDTLWDHIERREHDLEPVTDDCGLCDARGATIEAVAYCY